MPNGVVRRRRVCALPVGRRSDGTSKARRPPKLSEVTRPSATSSASASSTWVRKSPVPSTSSSKNDAPCVADEIGDRLRAGHRDGPAPPSAKAPPRAAHAGAPAAMIGVVRTGAARRSLPLRPPVARPEPRPGDASGEAEIVEPGRLVAGEARRQDLALPGAGRRLEALELADDDFDRVRPRHARIGGDPLPVEQEAQEVARGDRLDLGAQALDRVVVDAGEQPALAPFVRVRRVRREPPAQGEAFGFERRERRRDVLARQAPAAPPARPR